MAVDLADRSFWTELAPGLHIESLDATTRVNTFRFAPENVPAMQAAIRDDGYFRLGGLDLSPNLTLMVQAVRALDARGLAPVFAFLYDEFW